tara:strand:- start:356 stop:604 length:249 start_codon:yes stop_codon:yes gene_type:complete
MKTFATWALGGLLGLSSISALACTPEEAIAKGEHLAQLIYDRTKDQPGKAEELNARLRRCKSKTRPTAVTTPARAISASSTS